MLQPPIRHRYAKVIGGVFLTGVLMTEGCSAEKSDMDFIADSKAHMASNDYKAAVLDLKNALQLNPENTEARRLLARAYLKNQLGAEAEKELIKTKESGAPEAEFIADLAQALYYQYKYQALLDLETEGKDIPPSDLARVLYLKAVSGLTLGKRADARTNLGLAATIAPETKYAKLADSLQSPPDKALSILKQLIKDEPGFSEAHILLSKFHLQTRSYDEATVHLKRAIELEPKRLPLHLDLARTYLRKNLPLEAEKQVDKLLRLQPNMKPALLFKSKIVLMRSDWSQLNELADRIKKVDKHDDLGTLYKGIASYYLQNWESSYRSLSSVKDTFDNHPAAFLILKHLERKLGYVKDDQRSDLQEEPLSPMRLFTNTSIERLDLRQQVREYEELLKESPNDLSVLERLTTLKLGANDPSVTNELEKILSMRGEAVISRALLVRSYISQNQLDKALKLSQELIDSHPDRPEGYLLTAEVYASGGNYAGAYRTLDQATARIGETVQLLTLRYRTALREKNFDAAIPVIQRVMELEPGATQPLVQLYSIEKATGRKLVRSAAQSVMEAHPDKHAFISTYATLLINDQNFSDARQVLSLIPESSPQYSLTLGLLGRIAVAEKNLESALDYFTQWHQAAPDQRAPLQAVILISHEIEQYDTALSYLDKASKKAPGDQWLKLARIGTLLKAGKEPEGLAAAENYHKAYGESPASLAILGSHYFRIKNKEKAEQYFVKRHKLINSNRSAIKLASIYVDMALRDKAANLLKDWLTRHPEDQMVRMFYTTSILKDDADLKTEQFKILLEQNPENFAAWNNFALHLKADNKLSEALEAAKKAYQLKPTLPPVQDTYGHILLLNGHIQEAVKLLKKAYEAAPGDQEIAFHYALALKQAGELKLSAQIFEQISNTESGQQENAREQLSAIKANTD